MGKVYDGYENKTFKEKEDWRGIGIYRIAFLEGYDKSKIIKILNYFYNAYLFCKKITQLEKKYDHVLFFQTGSFLNSLAAYKLQKKNKVPYTIWTLDIWPDALWDYGIPKLFFIRMPIEYLIKKIYNNSANILVSSKNFSNKISRFLKKPKPIHHIPNWSLIEDKESEQKITLAGELKFIFTGNIGSFQNLEKVIAGFHQFANNNPKYVFHIVGDGSYIAAIKKLISEKQIANVTLHGRQQATDIPNYLKASDVAIVSLKDSGLGGATVPGKLQAYLKLNKPIFGIISGETKELIEDYKIGWTANPRDVENIEDVFKKISKTFDAEIDNLKINIAQANNLYDKDRIIDSIQKLIV